MPEAKWKSYNDACGVFVSESYPLSPAKFYFE